MDSSVSPKDEMWFLRVCHHISNAVYLIKTIVGEWWRNCLYFCLISWDTHCAILAVFFYEKM